MAPGAWLMAPPAPTSGTLGTLHLFLGRRLVDRVGRGAVPVLDAGLRVPGLPRRHFEERAVVFLRGGIAFFHHNNWPAGWLCQLDRLPAGNFRPSVRIALTSSGDGVRPTKLLCCAAIPTMATETPRAT